MDSESPSCGCKGVRYCGLCENTERVRNLKRKENEEAKYVGYEIYVFDVKSQNALRCPSLTVSASLEEIQIASTSIKPTDEDPGLMIDGLMLVPNFISQEDESRLMATIDKVEWAQSQSGRRKQDYGPQVNFKHKKVKTTKFIGMPEYADFLLEKMRSISEERLGHYIPFEMCNLEYEQEKKSAIEMHQDDMWIWGNRLISINLLSGAVMTMANETTRQLCFIWMPHRSLLCMANEARYGWKHGVLCQHVRGRRIALTMREAAKDFQEGGELYEKFGRDLIKLSQTRVPVNGWSTITRC